MSRSHRYDSELEKALRMSKESFKTEQDLRKRALEIEKDIERAKKAQWDEEEQMSLLIKLMKWQPLFVNRGVGCGIQNLGNSCFMNATLQCLAYTPAFSQLLCQSMHFRRCRTKKFCALCEMEKVMPLVLMGKEIVKPKDLFKKLPKINDLLNPGCQEDAHEFLQSLLDRMEMAYDDQYQPKNKKDPQNPIRTLFTGSTKTAIDCVRCRTTSVSVEPFCCISLDIDKTDVDLAEALEIFTRDELLRGDDKYFCSKCNRKCVAHKRLTLSELPPILALHFKRFSVSFQSNHHKQGIMKKMSAHVEFPEILDFKTLKNVIFEADRETVLIDPKYELYAVLVHSGPRLGYGHYYALIKSPDGYWFRMNDMEVIPVNTKHVLREQGYIVFYRRKSNNLMKCQLQRIKASKSVSLENDEDGDEEKEDTDNSSDIDAESQDAVPSSSMSGDMYLFGDSKLSDLSEQQLQIMKDQYEHSLEEQRKITENRRNQKRSKTVQNAKEKMKVIQERIKEINGLLQNLRQKRNGTTRIDREFHELSVTTDYFANNCNDPVSGGSMVVVDEVDAIGMENVNVENGSDKNQYVHVPPLATRPELLGDVHRQWSGNGSPEAVEVFWPMHDI